MTAPAPAQPEYIITEKQLQHAEEHHIKFIDDAKAIRSRPAGQTPTCQHWGIARQAHPDGDTNEWCCQHQPPAPAAAVLDIKIAEYESLVTTMEKFGDDVIPGWIRAGLRNMREKKKAAIRAREAGEHSSTRGDGVRSNM